MAANPLTRRVLEQMEEERDARVVAEARQRRLAERTAALTPTDHAELERRVSKARRVRIFRDVALGFCGMTALLLATGLW